MWTWIIAFVKYLFVYRSFIIDLFYYVEETIPDDMENKSIAKLDLFLKKFIELHKRLTNKVPSEQLLNIAKTTVEKLAEEEKASGE